MWLWLVLFSVYPRAKGTSEEGQEYLRRCPGQNWLHASHGSGNVAKLIDIDVPEFREDSAIDSDIVEYIFRSRSFA